VQYPAPGSPALAKESSRLVSQTDIGLDYSWGLDHGTWSVIKVLYPAADIPVVQLSLDYTRETQYHYDLAKQLSSLREKGILIIGSGNMVHNLRNLDWNKIDRGYDWAEEANLKFKTLISENNHHKLINYSQLGPEIKLAVPTPEHYLPLIYTLALKNNSENITFFNDKTVMGSISMTSLYVK
jgi:4,5-DOPA dioxygenase extradiol